MSDEASPARLLAASAAVARAAAAGGPPRAEASLGPITCVDHGVDQAWSVQALLPAGGQGIEHLADAVDWCLGRARGRGFGAVVAAADRGVLGERWRVQDVRPVYAMAGQRAGAPAPSRPPGLELDTAPAHADVVAAYGGWMQDVPLAAALVWPGDLARPDRRFVVAHLRGRPVGCALVWLADGLVHLSGIGVVAEHRGRGVGGTLVGEAARLGLEALGGPGTVWMHATPEGAALYSRLGFVRVDEHVTLTPGEGRHPYGATHGTA